MKRECLSHCFLGAKIKLTPQGKVYTIQTVENGSIVLRDNQGNFVVKPYGLDVYVINQHPESDKTEE